MAEKTIKLPRRRAKEKEASDPRAYLKKSTSYKIVLFFIYCALIFLGIITLYPFWYAVVAAFNEGKDSLAGGVYFWPRSFTMENIARAFQNPLLFNSIQISIFRTVLSIVLSVFFTSLMAYAFTKKDLPGRTVLLFFFYFTTLFSGGLIPTFILYRQIGFLNNFWVYVIPGIFSFYNMIILRTAFYSVPASLSESARIDGCSEFRIFMQIIIPLSLPTFATIALFVGIANWNDWFTGAYFVSSNRERWTAATLLNSIVAAASFESSSGSAGEQANINNALMQIQSQTATPESLKMAFMVILTAPILAVYPFVQKYFVKGVMIGSIKE